MDLEKVGLNVNKFMNWFDTKENVEISLEIFDQKKGCKGSKDSI